QMFLLAAKPARDVSGSPDHRQRHRINRILDAAMRGALGLHAFDACRRGLTGSEAVDLVIHDDIGQVHISSHRMQEMIAAYAVAVAIATDTDHLQIMIAELHPGADGQRTAVQRVHSVGVHEARKVRRATDTTDYNHLMRLETQLK